MKTYPMNMDLFLESYQGDDMRYGQDYDKYVCDDRDTSEYVQMIRECRTRNLNILGGNSKIRKKSGLKTTSQKNGRWFSYTHF